MLGPPEIAWARREAQRFFAAEEPPIRQTPTCRRRWQAVVDRSAMGLGTRDLDRVSRDLGT
eukprot:873720-Lingulodinium_polyedra.AAC.1